MHTAHALIPKKRLSVHNSISLFSHTYIRALCTLIKFGTFVDQVKNSIVNKSLSIVASLSFLWKKKNCRLKLLLAILSSFIYIFFGILIYMTQLIDVQEFSKKTCILYSSHNTILCIIIKSFFIHS